jgi:DNA polymerase-1
MIIVTPELFKQSLEDIAVSKNLAIDTETNGLYVHKGDRLFSIQVSTEENDYYFNFNPHPDHLGNFPPTVLSKSLIPQFVNSLDSGRVFLQNPVFDMGFLNVEGCDISKANLYATEELARQVNNDRFSVAMSALAKDIGMKKMADVKDYCNEHKLYEQVEIPGIKNKKKMYRFDLVPFDIISEYGCNDTRVTLKLGLTYLQRIAKMDTEHPGPGNLLHMVTIGKKLIPILWEMKELGVKIDERYCLDAAEFYTHKCRDISKTYKELSGIEFVDSAKNHAIAFEKLGHKYGYTEKGNPSFTDELLEAMDYPIAEVIRQYRKYNRKSSFFSAYVYHSDRDSILHANLNQSATATGRFSSSDPNLQQVPKRGDGKYKYPVRRAFIPREGYKFFTLDFDQFEYRMMLNKAGEMGVINQVLEGLDVHTATKNQMGIDDRDKAKTINFLLLYGGGIAVLARKLYSTHLPEHTLKLIQKYHFFDDYQWDNLRIASEMGLEVWEVEHGISILTDAKNLKELYFTKLPHVKQYVRRTIKQAEKGKLYNDFGRVYRFRNKDFAYKAPNYEIQGETADWIKSAMVELYNFLKPYESRMILQVHDELIFEVKNGEEHLVPAIKRIMENQRPTKYLPYTVGVDIAEKSWFDKEAYNAGVV